MIKLTLNNILEFYDMPQLFVATDAIGTNYLCLLYKQDEGCHYLGVQVSEMRLKNYTDGLLDLRIIYTEPEKENSLYEVLVAQEKIYATTLLQQNDITEDMLPAAGYYHNVDDYIANNDTETLQLDIPANDRNFFSDIVRRMGWNVSVLSEESRKIAVF